MGSQLDNSRSSWLPDRITLVEYAGDWESYNEALYTVFKRDFIDGVPIFRGRKVLLPRSREDFRDKNGTFVHLTTEGPVEENRTADLERCARIPWLRPMLENGNPDEVIAYRTKDSRGVRWVVALSDYSFAIVLQDIKANYLLLTAYVPDKNRRRQMERKYKRFLRPLGGMPI